MGRVERGARRDLGALFEPDAVAIVGASDDPVKWGNWLARGALRGERRRSVYLVNRRGGEVLGRPAYRSLAELPEAPALAVLAVPPAALEQAVEDAIGAGVRALVVITAGEADGDAGGARDRALAARARAAGVVLLGPNCLGVFDAGAELELVSDALPPGPIGLISQSGNLALEIGMIAADAGLGFSRFVSVGNQADVQAAELIGNLAEHPATELIAVYVEDFRDGREFAAAAEAATRAGKPVVLLAIEHTDATARAVASHTGALASDGAAIDAACRAAGIERVRAPQELVDVADGLLRAGPLRGRRVGVLADGGGHAGIAAVAAAAGRARAAAVRRRARGRAARRPAVHRGGVEPDRPRRRRRAGHPRVRPHRGGAAGLRRGRRRAHDRLLRRLRRVRRGARARRGDRRRGARGRGACRRAPAAWCTRCIRRRRRPTRCAAVGCRCTARSSARSPSAPGWRSAASADRAACPASPRRPSRWPPPATTDARALLAAAGVRFAVARTVPGEAAAVAAAGEIGYPVVLKALGLLHKSDSGGVALGLRDEAALRAAVADMEARLAPPAFSVEQMAPLGDGVELLVGARWDARFGPIALVGLGGLFTEILDDVAVALAPVDEERALALIGSLRSAPLLRGARGRAPLDVAAAAAALAALSRVAAVHPEIAAIEVNPLLVLPSGAIGLDARLELAA